MVHDVINTASLGYRAFVYTSLFHQRNGSSKNTYNIINEENTISKHKVNMTVISLLKNITIKLQSILEYSPQLNSTCVVFMQ